MLLCTEQILRSGGREFKHFSGYSKGGITWDIARIVFECGLDFCLCGGLQGWVSIDGGVGWHCRCYGYLFLLAEARKRGRAKMAFGCDH
ncbi:MAG: hypothetical protein ACYSR5_02250 [Planctomycetota bacterium]|jgi:hypothetical protein